MAFGFLCRVLVTVLNRYCTARFTVLNSTVSPETGFGAEPPDQLAPVTQDCAPPAAWVQV